MSTRERTVFGFLAGVAQSLAPFVARVVLCLAFMPLGWSALSGSSRFDEAQTATLRDTLDVSLDVSEDGTSAGDSYLELALLLHDRHIGQEVIAARVIAGVQLVGGILILTGFLSRLVSLAFLVVLGILYLPYDVSPEALRTMAQFADADRLINLLHLSAAALCLLIVAQGPGFLSLDTLVFGLRDEDPLSDD